MTDLVGPILEVIKFIGRPAAKYLNYHRKFKDYVDGFKQAQKDLQVRMGDIQQQLQDEHGFGKKPKQELESWFKKVEEKLGHAKRVEDKVSKGKYLFRSCLGKLVDEETQEMKEVYAEGHFSGSLVVNDLSVAAAELRTTELVGETDVRDEIYQFLMGNEVRKIGVCGMGGIGKTTIMTHVHNSLLKETKFSKLLWTTVSQDFDVRKLQNSIACQLNEELSDKDDTTRRAAILSDMLRRKGKHVLILDDVWRSFSLEEVGILEPTADNGCKLVLTTRSEAVVRTMRFRKVQVACLSTKEALQLFLSKVGEDTLSNPTLKSIMKDIVGECDGLPLAIVTVAGCMREIFDPILWEDALNELRDCIRSLSDMEDKVYGCLQFSYDRLQQIHKDCFLYCALYPEDCEIKKEGIIEYWMEEGLIVEMGTREAMQCCGHSVLQKLEENCLLERVGKEGTHVKMHDVVRDMALHITRKGYLVKAGKQLKEVPNEEVWSEDLEKVSLMHNRISKIPQNMKAPKFQKLTTLLLSHNALKEIPESFFKDIPNLKILDLSFNPIENLPISVSNLEKLIALLLHGCRSLYNLPALSKLQGLKKLDLGNTSIKEIPQGLETLVNLRYLNLGFTLSLIEIPSGLLSNLCHLQYLAIHPAPTRAEEMRALNKLEVFEGFFSNFLDSKLNVFASQRKKLHQYLIWVSHQLNDPVFYNPNRYKGYGKKIAFVSIDINSGDRIILGNDIQQLLVAKCKGMRSLNDICGLQDATDLKVCEIENCDELESISLSKCQLETLECLKLISLENLKGIVGESSVGKFSSLKQITLVRCGKIKYLFSTKWALHNLEVIDVSACYGIREIILSEGKGKSPNNGTIKYALPKLRTLVLSDLPTLKRICSKNAVMVCDSLQYMEIKNCLELKKISLYLLLLGLDKAKQSPPLSLKEIRVDPKGWWYSVEGDWEWWYSVKRDWDHPMAKEVLLPFLKFWDDRFEEWKQAVR